MSESSTRSKFARPRRGSDPVRIVAQGRRIVYWESGIVGVGARRYPRTTPERAEEQAEELRRQIERRRGIGPLGQAPLYEVMQAMVAYLKAAATPTSTVRQYRSNWNVWVPEEVRTVACCDLEWRHWTAIFDGLAQRHASAGTIRAVARTMGALIKFAVPRGYFDDEEPFTTPSRRASVVAATVAGARKKDGKEQSRVRLRDCPTRQEVEQLAAALEALYPSYGARFIHLAYATGMRIGELLVLRAESVHLSEESATIDVDVQVDREAGWPATTLPKGGVRRSTIIWQAYEHVAASLVADAYADDGNSHRHLFPPTHKSKHWEREVGDLIAKAAESCGFDWRLHWLRHAFASVSLAPTKSGGYGLDLQSVQGWLGHQKSSTTLDFYAARQRGDEKTAYRLTSHLPGVTAGPETQRHDNPNTSSLPVAGPGKRPRSSVESHRNSEAKDGSE